MKKLGIVCSLLAATFVIAAAYGGEFKSGLQVGEKAPAFNVVNVTGQGCVVDYAKDSRDKLCYR